MEKLYIFLIVINFVTFIIFGVDKLKAISKKTRVSERMLFCLSFIGGFIGSLLGMQVFRHKTLKLRFYVFNFVCLCLWIYIIWFCL